MNKNIQPKVAIIGRTNVGKSTLFNRLVQSQKSLVSAIPGTTRDRCEADCIWLGKVIRIIDTGGLDRASETDIDQDIAKQARAAIKVADLIIFVADGQAGLQGEDKDLIQELAKSKKPVIAVANKIDNNKIRSTLDDKEWHNIPFGKIFDISAHQGTGVGDLLDEIYLRLEQANKPAVEISDIVDRKSVV